MPGTDALVVPDIDTGLFQPGDFGRDLVRIRVRITYEDIGIVTLVDLPGQLVYTLKTPDSPVKKGP